MSERLPKTNQATSSREPLLAVDHVQIGYNVDKKLNIAVRDASFEIFAGEKMMLLGPSGSGKSTILKAVAGFLKPVGGRIVIAGRESLEPEPDRAVVFQEFDQLFPWRTVEDNVAYSLRVTGRDKREAAATAKRYIEMMGLSLAADRYPHQLSGGMKQRVAIARALALDPLMLLMDEPFGSLDAQTRSRLQREVHEISERTHVTILFVTHSIQEALFLGDRVVVLADAPSHVQEIVDVSGADDPDSEEFITLRRHLRQLLAEDEQDVHHAVFE
ncbi:MAG: ATP-binding cassette domain-containing protein [Actinobacteria bacterium]|nr:ATP-binding cassette domain-containing protein [Actinomycetota bacterium]MQB00165.1 ATP-binding cassette domain-containing protein [Actinomycetota bacterium]